MRYFALKDLVGMAADSPDVVTAQEAVMTTGPVPAILAKQHPVGYWTKPG